MTNKEIKLTIEEKIRKLIHYDDRTEEFQKLQDNKEAKLGDDYGLDSLDILELAWDLENELDIPIPDNSIDNWKDKTIEEITEICRKLKEEKV